MMASRLTSIMAYILPPTPISPISFTEDILQCPICKKTFKSKRVHLWGPDASSKLAQVFGDTNWRTKFYHGNEVTSVVTNLDDIDTEEENPLDRKRKFKIYSQRNPRYKREQVIIEWKP
ncbi:unnamed protein product [Rhizophagus irregularis]|nr:unnamed protein product [Rhizophagus irregularis]